MADFEHGLGWRPDLPDQRDHRLNTFTAPQVPRAFDRRGSLPAVWDQGQVGSCTGHGAAAAWIDAAQHAGGLLPTPSRLFLYWNARELEGSSGSDAGATIRDVVKGLAQFGAPPEEDWPYDTGRVLDAPPPAAYAHGLQRQALVYARVPHTKAAVSSVIALGGLGVVFGFTVYESFNRIGSDGIMPMPGRAEAVLGGHCVYAVGYNPDYVICRNSWGAGWGQAGHFSMPWGFFLSGNASDLWVVSTVEALPFTVTDPRA